MLRKLLIAIGAVVALLVVAVILVVVFIDPNDYREQIATQATEQLGRPVALNGPMELKVFPRIGLELNDLVVGNPAGFPADAPLARVGSAVASVQLLPLFSGRVLVGDIRLQQATVNILTLDSGATNLDGLGGTAAEAPAARAAPADLSSIRTGAIRFDALRLNMHNLATDERQSLLIDRVDIGPFAAGEAVDFSVSGSVSSGDDVLVKDLNIDGVINVAPDLSRIGLPALSIAAELPGAGAELKIQAQGEVAQLNPLRLNLSSMTMDLGLADGTTLALSTPVTITMDPVTRLDLARLQMQLNLPAQQMAVDFSGAVNAVLDEVPRFELGQSEITLNGQRLQAQGQVSLGDAPSLNLNVQGETLDLNPLIAAATAGAEAGAGAPANTPSAGKAEPADDGDAAGGAPAADFSALRPWRMDMDLRLQRLLLPNLELNEVVGVLQARDGVITLDPLSARLFQGTFNGVATVDTRQNPPEVHLQPRLEGVAVQALMQLLSPVAPARGAGSMNLDIRFSGLDFQQIVSTLDGRGEFQVLDGAIIGVDFNKLLNEQLSRSDLTNVREAIGGETLFESLSGQFSAKSGVLQLPNISMDTLQFGVAGNGQMDLTQQTLDYDMTLNLGEQLRGQMPKRLMDVTDGVIPLKLSGALTAPIVTVNVESLLQQAVQKQAKKQGRKLLDRLFNRDKDKAEGEDDSDNRN